MFHIIIRYIFFFSFFSDYSRILHPLLQNRIKTQKWQTTTRMLAIYPTARRNRIRKRKSVVTASAPISQPSALPAPPLLPVISRNSSTGTKHKLSSTHGWESWTAFKRSVPNLSLFVCFTLRFTFHLGSKELATFPCRRHFCLFLSRVLGSNWDYILGVVGWASRLRDTADGSRRRLNMGGPSGGFRFPIPSGWAFIIPTLILHCSHLLPWMGESTADGFSSSSFFLCVVTRLPLILSGGPDPKNQSSRFYKKREREGGRRTFDMFYDPL